MTPDIKYQIAHSEKNFIDIELDNDGSDSSEEYNNEK